MKRNIKITKVLIRPFMSCILTFLTFYVLHSLILLRYIKISKPLILWCTCYVFGALRWCGARWRRGERERGGAEVCRGELRGIVYDKGEVDHHKRSQAEAGGAMARVIRGGKERGARRRRRHGCIPLHGPELLLSQHARTQWFTVTGVHLQDSQGPCRKRTKLYKCTNNLSEKEDNLNVVGTGFVSMSCFFLEGSPWKTMQSNDIC